MTVILPGWRTGEKAFYAVGDAPPSEAQLAVMIQWLNAAGGSIKAPEADGSFAQDTDVRFE